MSKFKSVSLRFLKGMLAGGLAQVAVYLGTGITITNTKDLKAFGTGLVMSFLVGAILAFEKALTWTET